MPPSRSCATGASVPRRSARLLKTAFVVPVFTAHPSEARRRTILEKLETLSRLLDRLEYGQLLPHERRAAESAVAEELETFWLSSLVRSDRPTVLDEVRQGLGMVAGLFEVVPRLYREMEEALGRWSIPSLPTWPCRRSCASAPGSAATATAIRIVTPAVTAEAVRLAAGDGPPSLPGACRGTGQAAQPVGRLPGTVRRIPRGAAPRRRAWCLKPIRAANTSRTAASVASSPPG